MKKFIRLLAMFSVFLFSCQSFAHYKCQDLNILNDPLVLKGEYDLRLKMIEAERFGDARFRVEPTAKLVKTKSLEVINLFKCLIREKIVTVNLDLASYIETLDKWEQSQKELASYGGRMIPTEDDVQVWTEALEAIKMNRLAKAYIRNFDLIKKK